MSWKPKQCVIVPVDFSVSTAGAIQTGLDCAESPQAVHVVHVVFDLQPLSPFGYWSSADIDLDAGQSAAREHLHRFLAEHGFSGVRPVILLGDPGRAVVEYADQQKADLIVIPSHGYHGFQRLLLGSTAERVIRHAHCPVYVTRRTAAK